MKTGTFPVKSRSSGVSIVAARYAGGGAAGNCTKTAGRGISTVAYNAATGAYLITFEDTHPALLACAITIGSAGTTAAQKIANHDPASYSATAGTLPFFVTDVATPTAKDLASTEEVSIIAVFAETAITQ